MIWYEQLTYRFLVGSQNIKCHKLCLVLISNVITIDTKILKISILDNFIVFVTSILVILISISWLFILKVKRYLAGNTNRWKEKEKERIGLKDIVYEAMANDVRRKILRLLRWKNLTASEIANAFDISKPSISRHLDILKKAELVSCKRQGQFMIYSLNMMLGSKASL